MKEIAIIVLLIAAVLVGFAGIEKKVIMTDIMGQPLRTEIDVEEMSPEMARQLQITSELGWRDSDSVEEIEELEKQNREKRNQSTCLIDGILHGSK